MMRRIDDLFAREKRKAATGKTDADYAKLPLLMKFEDRARYVQDTYRTLSVCVYVRLYVLGSREQSLTIFLSLVCINHANRVSHNFLQDHYGHFSLWARRKGQ